ncbi:MAG TPA: cadherin domain-containing protein [Gammaproteobacteria bacterium]|nr:cadherin domain-containing protein [Gammaproteobacteria bacterium]
MRKPICLIILSAVLAGMLLNAGIASAHWGNHKDKDRLKRRHHHRPQSETKLLEPRSLPYALPGGAGEVDVLFNVQLLNSSDNNPDVVYLLEKGSDDCDSRHEKCNEGWGHGAVHKLNDRGQNGDQIAGDNVYSATIRVTAKNHPGAGKHLGHDECLPYRAFAMVESRKLLSPEYFLCTTPFPDDIAESNTSPENLIFTDKETSPAIADELLVRFDGDATTQQILGAARAVGAQVVGSVLPRDLYQFKFPRRLTATQLVASIRTLLRRSGVQDAYPNRVGNAVAVPSDPEFSKQHGLQWINADDAWDLGATGAGVTVTVLDTRVDTHPDLPVGGTDTANHGTAVAGVIAATYDNATGISGIAYDSTLESFTVSPDDVITMAEMVSGFQKVAASGTGEVVTAGFNITLAPPGTNLAGIDQWDLCSAINDVVLNGSTPVAVVISAAGNNNSNGWHYPSKCNDSSAPANARLTNKNLLITVMASVTCDSGCTPDTRLSISNYGPWIDVVAPGQNTRTTNNSNAYSNFTGTSMAMAHVAGVAAQMLSCDATVSQIQSRMTGTAPVNVSYPGGGNKPRIDAYQSVLAGNTAPTGLTGGSASIDEGTDTSLGYTVGTLSAVDANVCDEFSYSIQGGADAGSFSIGGADMDQLILTAGALDFETKSSYNVTVRVTDAGGLTFDQPFTVTVNDLVENAAPVVDEQSFAIDENSGNGSNVGTVVATDAEGNVLSFSISGGNTNGAFAIDSGSGAITVANSQALDFETTPSFALTVEVSDGALTDTATITVDLNNLEENTAPVIEDQVFAIDENSIKGTLVGAVVASDAEGDPLSFSITGGNSRIVAFNISPDGVLSVADGSALDFETTPSFALTVQVSDGVLTDTATITVSLNDAEEPIFN